ncbi:AAA-like domain-containing protein [Candidatus Marithioploca araucensis]|uniref:AAA-like domain-containing protein n=1 Tax=Candidatus Marithioploca araucensis TaxID=70273 RepID=A0ABT7VRN5_9GAMM|nr:AAA-like domain-containing protein [Candidatus Marithioploca araucensis]
MREFNTTGPCDPAKHYTVMREALIATSLEQVKKGRYFTLFAPRQAGKTTFFQLMIERLKESYTPVWITFENLTTVNKETFYQDFDEQLKEELLQYGFQTDYSITDPRSLANFFKNPHQIKPIVLVIDEFEGIPDCVLSEVMHSFRKIYHKREYHRLHSLLLVGVSTIAELVISSASPFNITEELQIPYFTQEEVNGLIKQYVTESNQVFEENVIKTIYDNTQGQPGLVCALCSYLVEKLATNRRKPVTMAHYYRAEHHFLTERFDKNIINIVQKARGKRNFMLKLLFDEEPLPFSIHEPDIAWLYANGVIDKDNGETNILVPLYKKVLITAFRPSINGETRHYINSPDETINQYLTQERELNVNALLEEYRAYIRRRGFRAFDTEHLKEAAWHYSLDGFINFFIQCLGGQTFVEVPTGRGRTDILILYQNQKYVIETKRFVNHYYFKQGKGQLVKYLKSEGISEGYYVVFSNLHTEKDELFSEELIQGKRIYTHLIPTKFEQPSRLPVLDELKFTESEKIANNMLKMETFSIEKISQATGVSLDRIKALSVQ